MTARRADLSRSEAIATAPSLSYHMPTQNTRDPAAIAAEIRDVLQAVNAERAATLAAFDDLTACVLSADAADLRQDSAARDELCERMLDLAHDVLGDCDPVELLCALLGYDP